MRKADYIQMPPFEAFTDADSYYATLAYESAYWTKHPSRLAREFWRKPCDDEGYPEEELEAEAAQDPKKQFQLSLANHDSLQKSFLRDLQSPARS